MWKFHWPLLQRPGNIEMQLDLYADYKTNEEIRPKIHEYFRNHRPPAQIVWGRHEVFFTVEVSEAYRRDLPEAESTSWTRAIGRSKRTRPRSSTWSGTSSSDTSPVE